MIDLKKQLEALEEKKKKLEHDLFVSEQQEHVRGMFNNKNKTLAQLVVDLNSVGTSVLKSITLGKVFESDKRIRLTDEQWLHVEQQINIILIEHRDGLPKSKIVDELEKVLKFPISENSVYQMLKRLEHREEVKCVGEKINAVWKISHT